MLCGMINNADQTTADAFANSWNNLPAGSIYTAEQFADWLAPLTADDVKGKTVLELGCGNGSLMAHLVNWQPTMLVGVDLGSSVETAKKNMSSLSFRHWRVEQADLVAFESDGFDVVYCIGVLHHLQNPRAGFAAIIRNVKPGGRFHAWVYAREGNGIIVYLVDPLRKLVSHSPWWLIKYGIAMPLAVPFFCYAKFLAKMPRWKFLKSLPLYEYSQWIAKREFAFFRHVAFDQLVTPQTTYLSRATIESWLKSEPRVVPDSIYIIKRNGNSWKFGGKIYG